MKKQKRAADGKFAGPSVPEAYKPSAEKRTLSRLELFGDDYEAVEHPPHYGGEENPYEAIKVVEAWDLGFCLGNAIKYICRAGKKGSYLEDLRKAVWYLQREIERHERGSES